MTPHGFAGPVYFVGGIIYGQLTVMYVAFLWRNLWPLFAP